MGVRSSHTSELIFDECKIPKENLIGQERAGFLMAMQTVEWDRSALMAPFVGGMTYVLNKCVRYAGERHQFGRPISQFQAIKHKLADIKNIYRGGQVPGLPYCLEQRSGKTP